MFELRHKYDSFYTFRLVSAGWGDEDKKFFKTEASDLTNGCFLCVMKREVSKRELKKTNGLFIFIIFSLLMLLSNSSVFVCVGRKICGSGDQENMKANRHTSNSHALNPSSVSPVLTK